jgi:hypothetical protein
VTRASSGIGMRSSWQPLEETSVADIPLSVGVYEIADELGNVAARGFAGGRSVFGLRGEIAKLAADSDRPLRYRVEVTMSYTSRLKELTEMLPTQEGAGNGSRID